jgi:hypothetical protein
MQDPRDFTLRITVMAPERALDDAGPTKPFATFDGTQTAHEPAPLPRLTPLPSLMPSPRPTAAPLPSLSSLPRAPLAAEPWTSATAIITPPHRRLTSLPASEPVAAPQWREPTAPHELPPPPSHEEVALAHAEERRLQRRARGRARRARAQALLRRFKFTV